MTILYRLRHWLIRTIANGDAVAMNFTSNTNGGIEVKPGQALFDYNLVLEPLWVIENNEFVKPVIVKPEWVSTVEIRDKQYGKET